MEKRKITLIDKNFEGRDIINIPGVNFSWCTENRVQSNNVFITDYCLNYVDKIKHTNIKKIAWLLEPRDILPDTYDFITANYHKFHKVLTYDRELISKINNGLFTPYGTFWAEKNNEPEKNKIVSMIASFKSMTTGHRFRHEIYNRFNGSIDYYGSITGKRITKKDIGLSNYMFSIAVENCKQDGYFTEKILDCFATKTVPLYWGDSSVSEFFNPAGIITFNSLEELKSIIEGLNYDKYCKMKDAIEDNYMRIDNYHVPEIYIERNYSNLLN